MRRVTALASQAARAPALVLTLAHALALAPAVPAAAGAGAAPPAVVIPSGAAPASGGRTAGARAETIELDLDVPGAAPAASCVMRLCACPGAGDAPALPAQLTTAALPILVDWEAGILTGAFLLGPFQLGDFEVSDASAVLAGVIFPDRVEIQLTILGAAVGAWHPEYWTPPGSISIHYEMTGPRATPAAGVVDAVSIEVRSDALACADVVVNLDGTSGTAQVDWNGPRPAVLVHGLFGNEATWGLVPAPNLKTLLIDRGVPARFFTFPSVSLPDWNLPIEDLSAQLGDSLASWDQRWALPIEERGVDLIGYSMGGLVVRYLVAHPERFDAAARVEGLVCLGAPHYGAAKALLGRQVLDTLQLLQMEMGSDFVWDLHRSWVNAQPPLRVLNVVGSLGYAVPHDGVVLLSSQMLENFGHPSVFIPNSHSGPGNMAFITDPSHPSFVAIDAFLAGETPESHRELVEAFDEGLYMAGLFDPDGVAVPVGADTVTGARVSWVPDPTLNLRFPWWPWLTTLGSGVQASGKYYATGVDEGAYTLTLFAHPPGFRPVLDHQAAIVRRQARVDSITVFPADAFATRPIDPGDPPAVRFGDTDVSLDFAAGPGGDVSVTRVDETPPATAVVALPHYWDLVTGMPHGSFSTVVTLDYSEAEVAAAGLGEEALSVATFDGAWHALATQVDPGANTASATTSHLTLFALGAFGPAEPPAAIGPFTLLEPAHGDTGIAPAPACRWRSAGDASLTYVVYVGTDPLAGPGGADSSAVAGDTTLTWPATLPLDTDHIWWVRATDGQASRFNLPDWQQFRTSTVSAVELVMLEAEASPGRVVLRWRATADSDLLGFVVWRSTGAGSGFERLSELLRGAGPYRFVDASVATGHTYEYRLEARDRWGRSQWFGPIAVAVRALPLELAIRQNRPNPFQGSTSIGFELPGAAAVELTIYGVDGRAVRRLVDGARAAGAHTVTWDGKTDAGAEAAAGIYFYRLAVGGRSRTRKMHLLQ